jgi:hypothetical protein
MDINGTGGEYYHGGPYFVRYTLHTDTGVADCTYLAPKVRLAV